MSLNGRHAAQYDFSDYTMLALHVEFLELPINLKYNVHYLIFLGRSQAKNYRRKPHW